MLSTLSIYSPANLNLFFRFGLSENLQSDSGTAMQSEKQVSFPLPASEPVSGRCCSCCSFPDGLCLLVHFRFYCRTNVNFSY